MVGKHGVLCAVTVVAGLAFAMPSNKAIEKVKADIDVIVRDVDSREKGDWAKAGDAILSLTEATTNEVERFLLSKEATFRYLKSGNGGKAKGVLSAFANDSASVLAIDEEIRRRLSFKEQRALKTAPAFADYEAFVTFVAKEQREKASAVARLADLEAKYAKDKENVRNRNLLAREYVLRDDWVKALPLLSRSKGDIGLAAKRELAKPEAKGDDAVAIGDGWWNVEGKDYPKEMTEACHRHAAEWYRTAQKDGTLANLVRMRIGGRIEEVESKSGPQVLKPSEKTEVSSVFPTASVKGGKTIRIPLEGKGKAFVDLVACPAGEFTMGWSAAELKADPALAGIARPCEVKMSKPFWMSETLVSEKVWAEVMGEQAEDDNPKAVTYEELEKFLEKFKAKMRGKIPSGYVVRLPVDADPMTSYDVGSRFASTEAEPSGQTAQSWTLDASVDGVNWQRLDTVVSNKVAGKVQWRYAKRGYAATNNNGKKILAGIAPAVTLDRGLDDVSVATGARLVTDKTVVVRKITINAEGMGTLCGVRLEEGGIIDIVNAPMRGSLDVAVDLTGVTLPATFSFRINGAVDRRQVSISSDLRKIQIKANGLLLIFR